jgi:hypothetical protein
LSEYEFGVSFSVLSIYSHLTVFNLIVGEVCQVGNVVGVVETKFCDGVMSSQVGINFMTFTASHFVQPYGHPAYFILVIMDVAPGISIIAPI